MPNLIYKLYNTDLSGVHNYYYSSEMCSACCKREQLLEALREQLDGKSAELFEQYLSVSFKVETEEKQHAFYCGMQTTARLAAELFRED